MKGRPILFSEPMVRAILDGRKTQTRRVCKLDVRAGMPEPEWKSLLSCCPYGQPGLKLWVRETWQADPPNDGSWGYTAWAGSGSRALNIPERFRHPAFCLYRAGWLHSDIRWRPSIHMPRWASRITLEIKDLRVERLKAISTSDCWAEGISQSPDVDPVHEYQDLWESINGLGSWDENPWVWVIQFEVTR